MVVRAHLESLAAAGVGGILTYCSAPTVAAVEASKAALKSGLLAAVSASSSTAAAAGRQLLQQQPQQQQQQAVTTAATAAKTTAAAASTSSSVKTLPAERPTNASALSVLVTQAASLGLGVGFVVPEYRHRNARTVRDDLRWCLEVAQNAVKGSAQARGALAARTPAAVRAQPLAPLLSHQGKAVFLVKSAASIPCHHWTALLKPGGAFSVREEEGLESKAEKARKRKKKMEAAVREGLMKREKSGEAAAGTATTGAAAVAGAGAVSGGGSRNLLVAASSSASSSSSSSSSSATAAAAAAVVTKTTIKGAFASSSSSSSSQQQQRQAQPLSKSSSTTSSPPPTPTPISLDGFWFAEWRDRDDGDVAASCGFDGVATPPGDDGTDGAPPPEDDEDDDSGGTAGAKTPFGAEPWNWPAMRARSRRQGLAFLATVSPGSDATPVRPWSAPKVRKRGRVFIYFILFRESLFLFFFRSTSRISTKSKKQKKIGAVAGARRRSLLSPVALGGALWPGRRGDRLFQRLERGNADRAGGRRRWVRRRKRRQRREEGKGKRRRRQIVFFIVFGDGPGPAVRPGRQVLRRGGGRGSSSGGVFFSFFFFELELERQQRQQELRFFFLVVFVVSGALPLHAAYRLRGREGRSDC